MRPGLGTLAAAFILLVTSIACRQFDEGDPQAVYSEFYREASSGNWRAVFDLLDSRSQRCLRKISELLAVRAGTQEEPLSFYLKQMAAQRQAPLRRIEIVERKEDKVELEVTAGPCNAEEDCSRRRVKLVREDGRWRVSPEFKGTMLFTWGKEEC